LTILRRRHLERRRHDQHEPLTAIGRPSGSLALVIAVSAAVSESTVSAGLPVIRFDEPPENESVAGS
jgi:hypothetical protein